MDIRAVLVLLPAFCLAHPISTETCSEPDDFESMLAMYQAEDTLSIILPLPVQRDIELLNRRTHSDIVEFEVFRGPEQLLYGNKTCPTSMSNTDSAPIEERSTCPYYYAISHDPLRYPVVIAEARCKCMKCFDDSTGDNLCEAVYFPKTVLRRQKECINGIYYYKPETYYVQNACVCAKRRFLLTSTPEASGNANDQPQSSTPTSEEQHSDAQEERDSNTGTDAEDDDETQNAATPTTGATTNYPFTFP